MNTLRLAALAGVVVLSACSDSSNNATVSLPDTDDVSVQTDVLLTQLVDDIFMASENSEPVEINDLNIVDDADEYSFSYLIENE